MRRRFDCDRAAGLISLRLFNCEASLLIVIALSF
jgi:hypothetical protein